MTSPLRMRARRVARSPGDALVGRVTLLLVASCADAAAKERINNEFRAIRERANGSPAHEAIQIVDNDDISGSELASAVLEHYPAVVHFSGHGADNGELHFEALFKSSTASPETLAELFEPFSGIVKCVLLNACHSAEAARRIAKYVDVAIGVEGDITDAHAQLFAANFYAALARGWPVEWAFKASRSGLAAVNQPVADRLVKFVRDGCDSSSVYLVPRISPWRPYAMAGMAVLGGVVALAIQALLADPLPSGAECREMLGSQQVRECSQSFDRLSRSLAHDAESSSAHSPAADTIDKHENACRPILGRLEGD